jgi:hypothetical protein
MIIAAHEMAKANKRDLNNENSLPIKNLIYALSGGTGVLGGPKANQLVEKSYRNPARQDTR